MVNGHPCTIVGVTPPGFSGTFAFSESELYLPLNWQSGDGFDDRDRGLHAIARLRAGVTLENAQAVMKVVAERLALQYPDSNANLGLRVLPERLARPEEDQSRTNALGAAIMLAMVILVMIIAAVNVTNLLLARTAGRDGELAIRAALGAGTRPAGSTDGHGEPVAHRTWWRSRSPAGNVDGPCARNHSPAWRSPGPIRLPTGWPRPAYAATVSGVTGLLVGLVCASACRVRI